MNINNSDSEINFKELIASAERAKQEPSVIKLDFTDALDDIILELKKIEKDPSHIFSIPLRTVIIDSMPWSIPFFKELMEFMKKHNQYHKELNKLQNKGIK